MSWGYWGIVAGLVAMLALFFVCMELMYPSAKKTSRASNKTADKPGESAQQATTSGRHAA
jgi:hypothetical protein